MGFFNTASKIGSEFLKSHYANNAAKKQISKEQQNQDLFRNTYNDESQNLSPYISAGKQGINDFRNLATQRGQGQFLDNFYNSALFNSLSSQGRSQQLASAEATGSLGNTNTQSGLAGIAPNLGLNFLDRQRSIDQYLSNTGLNAIGQQNQLGSEYQANYGQANQNIGQLQAQDELAKGRARSNALRYFGKAVDSYGPKSGSTSNSTSNSSDIGGGYSYAPLLQRGSGGSRWI